MRHRPISLCLGIASWLLAILFLTLTLTSLAAAATQETTNGGGFLVTTIFTNIPGHPTADVPGYPGVHFGPGTGTTHFDRVYGSPNGNWLLTADTDLPTTNDEVLLVNGVVKIFEGDPAPWASGENTGFLDSKLGINDNGTWVFTTNTDGPTTSDEYMVIVSATDVFTVAAQEGDPVAALPGATWGSTIESAVIAADDTTGQSGDSLGGPPSTEDDALFLGATVLGQEGITVPPGQSGAEFWENFDLGDYWITADGSQWLAQGDLTGDTASDDVVVVNGSVVIQENTILPSTTFTNPVDGSGIVGVHMTPNGDWFARGNNDTTEQDWVYGNNGLVTAVGEPIYTGATEQWDDAAFSDCFFLHVGNGNGSFVIGGVTDGSALTNGVLVANNEAVVAREGDQLDLDNDGTLDDAYFDTFGNDDGFLADDGTFYIVATIKDNTDTRIGQGFFSIDLSSLLNTPPMLSSVMITSPINENDVATITGNILDPDLNDTFTLVYDWGDGTVLTTTFPTGTLAFSQTHQYLDDNPSGTPSDMYTVSLTLFDSSSGMSSETVPITVNNLDPTADAGPDFMTVQGQPASFSGMFTDAGPQDTHTIQWDFGTGNIITGTLTPTYTFTAGGSYTVTLTVIDDDTGADTDTVQVGVYEDIINLPVIIR